MPDFARPARAVAAFAFALGTFAASAARGGDCVLTCPPNSIVGTDAPACSTTINFPAPTAVGICGPITCTPPSGTTRFPGAANINCTEPNAGGACSFTITVIDDDPPPLTCGANTTVQSPDGNPIPVNYPGPQFNDNCPGQVSAVCVPPSNASFPVGVSMATCTATDSSSNQSSCQVTVTVLAPSAVAVPALSLRGLAALGMLLSMAGLYLLLKRR